MAALVLRHQQRNGPSRAGVPLKRSGSEKDMSFSSLERIGGTFNLGNPSKQTSGLNVTGLDEIAEGSVLGQAKASKLSSRGLWQPRFLFLTQDNLYIAAERTAPTKEGWISLAPSDSESESNVEQVYLVLAQDCIAYWRSENAHINLERPEAVMAIRACTMSFSGFLPGAHRAIPLLTIHDKSEGRVFEFGCESIAERSAWLDVFTSHKQHAERNTVHCEVVDIIRLRDVEAVERLDSKFFGTPASPCHAASSKPKSDKSDNSKSDSDRTSATTIESTPHTSTLMMSSRRMSNDPKSPPQIQQIQRRAFSDQAAHNFVFTHDDEGFYLFCPSSPQPLVCFRREPQTGKKKALSTQSAPISQLKSLPDLDVEAWMGLISKSAAAAKFEHERLYRFLQMQSRGQQFMTARPTQMFLGLVICASFLTIVCEAQIEADEGSRAAFVLSCLDFVFLAIFIAELLVNLFCFWWWPFWQDGWLRFDFAVVALSICQLVLEYTVGSSVPGIKQLRVLRTFRIIKAFGRNKELKKIIHAVVASIGRMLSLSLPPPSLRLSASPSLSLSLSLSLYLSPSLPLCLSARLYDVPHVYTAVGHATVITVLVMSIFCTVGVEMFKVDDPESFGTFIRAFHTLFSVISYGQWTENLPAINEDGTGRVDVIIFTYGYVLIVNVVLLQVVVAVLLDNFFRAAEDLQNEDVGADSMTYTSPLDVLIEPIAERFSSQQDLDMEFQKLFQAIDDDESGRVDFNEIKYYIAKERASGGGPQNNFTEDQFEALTVQYSHAAENVNGAPCSVGTLTCCVTCAQEEYALCDSEHKLHYHGFRTMLMRELHRFTLRKISRVHQIWKPNPDNAVRQDLMNARYFSQREAFLPFFFLVRALSLSVADGRHRQALILANKLQLLQLRSAGTCPEVPPTPSQNNSCTALPFPKRTPSAEDCRRAPLSGKVVERRVHVDSEHGNSAEGTGRAGGGEGGSTSGTALLVSQNLQMISGLVATLDSVASPHDIAVHMQLLEDSYQKMQLLMERAHSKAEGLSTPPLPLPALPLASSSSSLTAHLLFPALGPLRPPDFICISLVARADAGRGVGERADDAWL